MITDIKYILLFTSAFMFSSCERKMPEYPESTASVATDAYISLKGIYVWGEGVETFTPCGDGKAYWAFPYTDEMWETLKSEHESRASGPYGGIYVEVNGVLGPKLHPIIGGEYAADYDGHVVIENVSVIRARSDTDCKL